ncbi:hypothetical protein PABG_11693 [Paracoccidioides brasiliensis Pb03]|nr:hypothetical protein PABG_11693 [Paracoccidioides brasiliensis Pb03]
MALKFGEAQLGNTLKGPLLHVRENVDVVDEKWTPGSNRTSTESHSKLDPSFLRLPPPPVLFLEDLSPILTKKQQANC